MEVINYFMGIGVIIVAALGIVAWLMWRKVWAHEQALQAQRDAALQTEVDKIRHIHESLNVLAQCVLDGQVRVAEAGIRMAVLLDQLPLSCDLKHRCLPVFELYQQTSHIPTHSAWNALDKQQRRTFEHELDKVEADFEHRVRELSEWISINPFGTHGLKAMH